MSSSPARETATTQGQKDAKSNSTIVNTHGHTAMRGISTFSSLQVSNAEAFFEQNCLVFFLF